jgi:predicted AlkP superfamily pyrophosphatase or phosphodiesterase
LLQDQDSYRFGASDDRAWETDDGGFGRVFPHSYGDGTSKYFTTWLTLSPPGDKLVLDFAKQALVEEQLGEDAVTDYLSVSFSSTDYVGHVFGPSSLEAEDNILRLDRTLADLLAFVDEKVGLENTLVVLSADHGGPDTPGYLKSLKIPAGYVDPDSWDKAAAIERIKKAFKIDGDLIAAYDHPYVYFSDAVKNNRKIDQDALEAAVPRQSSGYRSLPVSGQ